MNLFKMFLSLFKKKSATPITHVSPTVSTPKQQAVEEEIDSVVSNFISNCPNLLAHNSNVFFWQCQIKAIVSPESGFNPYSRYVETGLSKDAVTGKQNASEGLMQLSYQDAKYHGANFDWNKDKSLSDTDIGKSIFNIKNNIEAGMMILDKQLKLKGTIITKGSPYYWAVLDTSRPGHPKYLAELNKYLALKPTPIEIKPIETKPVITETVKPLPTVLTKKMKIAIIEGHGDKSSKGIDTGSVQWNGMTELAYTRECTVLINLRKDEFKHEVKTFTQFPTVGDAAHQVLAWKPDMSMELHTNAYNGKAKGCQCNVLSNDPASLKVGRKFSEMFCKKFNRVLRDGDGVLEAGRNERGVYNLAVVEALPVSILCEPFFGDNKAEWISPDVYVSFLIEFVNSL